jgi:Mce-associated membrane protein
MTTALEDNEMTTEADVPGTESVEALPLRQKLRRWGLIALSVLLGLAAVALGFDNHRHDADTAAAEKVRALGTEHVEELLSYDYKSIDADYAAEKRWLTPDFADEYSKLINGQFTPAAKKAHLVTQARVVAGGIEDADSDKVELLFFVNVVISPGKSTPSVTGTRLHVVLEHVGGNWLISAIDPV